MKRISNLFTKKNAPDEPIGSVVLVAQENHEEEPITLEAHEINLIERTKNKLQRILDIDDKPRQNLCATCRVPYRACVCLRCQYCNALAMSIKAYRHCSSCWKLTCPDCMVSSRGDMFLHLSEKDVEEMLLCEACADIACIRQLSRFEWKYAKRLLASEEKSSSHDYRLYMPYKFSWGLYMLMQASSIPQTCVNPSCEGKNTFHINCLTCGDVTIPSLFNCCSSGRILKSIAKKRFEPILLLESATMSVTNKMYNLHQKTVLDGMTEELLESYVRGAFPHFNRCFDDADSSIKKSPDALRKSHSLPVSSSLLTSSISFLTLLSTVAVTAAEVPASISAIFLSTCDHPLSRVLYLRRREPSYARFGVWGKKVEIVSFRCGEHGKASGDQVFSVSEVWGTPLSAKKSPSNLPDRIGVVRSSHSKEEGAADGILLFRMNLLQNLQGLMESEEFMELKEKLVELRKSGVQLVLSGHSMGGARALLMTLVLLLEHTKLMVNGIRCITFGAPAVVGGDEFLQFMVSHKLLSHFHHFIYRSDIVPRLSFFQLYLNFGDVCEGGEGEEGSAMGVEIQNMFWEWLDNQRWFTEQLDGSAASNKEGKLGKQAATTPLRHEREQSSISAGEPFHGYAGAAASLNEADEWWASGDIFFRHREPFDDDALPCTPAQRHHMLKHSARTTVGARVLFGCFHCIDIHPRRQYLYCDSSHDIRLSLMRRRSVPIVFRDHLMTTYCRVLLEIMNSKSFGEVGDIV